jgi:hypothetical protein
MSIEREPMNYKDYPNAVLKIEDLNALAPLPLSQYIVIGKIHLPNSTNSTSLDAMKGGAKRRTKKISKSKKSKKSKKQTRKSKTKTKRV